MDRVILVTLLTVLCTGCTLSFQNIDTHGTATDLVDENQSTTPNVSPTITVPVSTVPGMPSATK